jgi:hypothetical protein
MATAIQNPTMAKEDFMKSREYLALTPRQQAWVDSFLDSQNASLATRTAYGTKNDAYEAMLTRKIESSPRVIAALNLLYGRSERDAFLSELERTIQRERGPAKVSAMQLLARLKFTDKSETPVEPSEELKPTSSAPARRYAVGDLVQQDGHTGRVLAVDSNSRPTQVEELR